MTIRTILIKALRHYQLRYSKYMPHCRYTPSCSQYMIDAILLHGAIKGVFMGCLRLLRCNPHGDQGYDPVPEKNAIATCLQKAFGGNGGGYLIDGVLLAAMSLLYLFNRLTLGPASPYFMRCHFNDLCCGCWFMAFTNLILCPQKRRLSKWSHILTYIGLWGIYWEVLGSWVKRTAVVDAYDVVAYLAGGLIYWTVIVSRDFLRGDNINFVR